MKPKSVLRVLLVLALMLPLAGLSDPEAPPPDGESDEDKLVRLEALEKSLRAENKQLEVELATKKQRLETRIKPLVPSGTGYFSERSDPSSLVFTFASTHAGKKVNGQVDGKTPVSGKTAPAGVRASQKGKK